MKSTSYDVIVIGAGLNGLTTAAYLARDRQRVLVLDAADEVGGTTRTVEIAPGFRADVALDDAGCVSPSLIQELGLAAHGVELLHPDPAAWTPLPGDGGLSLWRDPARAAAEINRFSSADAARWPDFAERVAGFAAVLARLYALPAPSPAATPSVGELMPLLKVGRQLRGLGRSAMTDFLRTVPLGIEELLEDWFESDALKTLLAADGVRGVFQGPRSGGTAFAFLHHRVGAEQGDFGPRGIVRGGVGRLADALAHVVRAAGGEIRCGASVERVLVVNGRAVGVVLDNGDELRARAVASSADPHRTFLEIVGGVELQPDFVRAVENIRSHGIWSKVNLALGELPDFRGAPAGAVGAGRIQLADGLVAMEKAYDAAKYGRISEVPILEARIPSLADPGLAPAGRHVMSVRVQYTPWRLRDGAWNDAQRDALLDRVLDRLAEFAPNIRSAVIAAHVLTPADLEARFGASRGDTGHGQLALDQILFMRPVAGWSRYETPIDGLFLCGSGAHPGPGIAGGAGRLAAATIVRGLKGVPATAATPREPAGALKVAAK
jgi:phytoene dehydrogenase-like protein